MKCPSCNSDKTGTSFGHVNGEPMFHGDRDARRSCSTDIVCYECKQRSVIPYDCTEECTKVAVAYVEKKRRDLKLPPLPNTEGNFLGTPTVGT